jgi:regulator of nucleoside diphosphate kinase
MKPIIEKSEFQLLLTRLNQLYDQEKRHEIAQLSEELRRAKVVSEDKMPADVVRLFSTVKVEVVSEKRELGFTIVMPEEADLKSRKISILAPIAVALIGYKVGQEIEWHLAGSKKRLRVLSVMQDAPMEVKS